MLIALWNTVQLAIVGLEDLDPPRAQDAAGLRNTLAGMATLPLAGEADVTLYLPDGATLACPAIMLSAADAVEFLTALPQPYRPEWGDSIRFWQKRVMTATWSRIKQFWTQEQYVRITEGEKTSFMPLNSTYPESHIHVQKGAAKAGEPMNVVSEMEVDIIIDEAPEIATVQQEDFQTLASLAGDAHVPIPPQAIVAASGLSSARKKEVLDAMSGKLPDGTEIPPQVQQMLQQKEQQITQITQAQQQKTQEQQQMEQQLQQQASEVKLQMANLKAQQDTLQAKQNAFEIQFGARQQELEAQMEMLNAKEIELKSLQLLAAQNLKATQDAANAVVDGASKEAAITALTSKLETQQSEHKKQISDLAVAHNQQLHQEREKARAATAGAQEETQKAVTKERAKPRKVSLERGTDGKVASLTIT